MLTRHLLSFRIVFDLKVTKTLAVLDHYTKKYFSEFSSTKNADVIMGVFFILWVFSLVNVPAQNVSPFIHTEACLILPKAA